jgi:hypothetical protein
MAVCNVTFFKFNAQKEILPGKFHPVPTNCATVPVHPCSLRYDEAFGLVPVCSISDAVARVSQMDSEYDSGLRRC